MMFDYVIAKIKANFFGLTVQILYSISSVFVTRHNKPRPASHCMVLPPCCSYSHCLSIWRLH